MNVNLSREPAIGLLRSRILLIATTTAIVALLIYAFGVPMVFVYTRQEWTAVYRQQDALLRNLRPTHPDKVDPVAWEHGHGWLMTAHCNVCFPDYTSIAEMVRFRDDLERELAAKEVDLDTIHWIWDRLGETSPQGKGYIERREPLFRECIPRKKGG